MTDTSAAQLRRLLHVIPRIADGEEHSLDEIAELAGADRETLLGDLESIALRFGDPGGFVAGLEVYLTPESVSLTTGQFRRPMRLTAPELCALELGLAMLRAERPPDEHPAIDRARERLRKALVGLPADEVQEGMRAASLGAAGRVEHLATTRAALKGRQKARLIYRKSGATEAGERIICPYGLVVARGRWFIVAYCERSEGVRIFRLDRVESIEVLTATYDRREEVDVSEVLRDGYVFQNEDARTLRVRYSPRVARWIAERQGRELEADGTLTVDHPLADLDWAARHVLQYGPDVEVLEPAEVREEVVRRLRAALA